MLQITSDRSSRMPFIEKVSSVLLTVAMVVEAPSEGRPALHSAGEAAAPGAALGGALLARVEGLEKILQEHGGIARAAGAAEALCSSLDLRRVAGVRPLRGAGALHARRGVLSLLLCRYPRGGLLVRAQSGEREADHAGVDDAPDFVRGEPEFRLQVLAEIRPELRGFRLVAKVGLGLDQLLMLGSDEFLALLRLFLLLQLGCLLQFGLDRAHALPQRVALLRELGPGGRVLGCQPVPVDPSELLGFGEGGVQQSLKRLLVLLSLGRNRRALGFPAFALLGDLLRLLSEGLVAVALPAGDDLLRFGWELGENCLFVIGQRFGRFDGRRGLPVRFAVALFVFPGGRSLPLSGIGRAGAGFLFDFA